MPKTPMPPKAGSKAITPASEWRTLVEASP